MTNAELWLTYQFASRALLKAPSTTQLIELEFQNHKLSDLEDVLDHVFRQGFIEAKNRPATWWEKKDGQKVKGSHSVDDLLQQGIGKCPETALQLVIQDVPSVLWFAYVYRYNTGTQHVTQRIKLAPGPSAPKLERLANVTNHIFNQGFLTANLRPVVHWQESCGKKIEESVLMQEVLSWGEGTCEERPLRLFIDSLPAHTCPCPPVYEVPRQDHGCAPIHHHRGCHTAAQVCGHC